ncbi:MAG: ABC transporter substrate-binding protein [Planctomycetota bacterium]
MTVFYADGDEWILGPVDEIPKLLVFLPLVDFRDKDGQGKWGLAERWEHSPDYREWIVHLRRNIRWHDGTPVTAHDIKFTIDLWKHPDVLYYAGAGYGSITVLDDYTFKAIFANPSDSLLDGWDVYYPKHLLENLDPKEFTSWKFWTEPVGNGPYRYVRHVPRTMIEFEANPDHYKGKPKIERLVLKFGGYPLIELLSGNVDCIKISSLDAIKLADDPRFRVYQGYVGEGGRRNQIFWNHRNPLFGNVTVRRALTLAINRRELHRVLNFSDNFFITDGIYTGNQARFGEIPEPLPYDPEQAKRLFEEAGWHDRNANRIRDKDGREFHFTIIVEDGIHKQAAVYIQDQLRRVGIRMEIQNLHRSVIMQRFRDGKFDAAIVGTANGRGHQEYFGKFGKDVYSGYDNPRVTELISKGNAAMEADERDRIYRELSPIFTADMPVTFLFPHAVTLVAHRRIKGLSSPECGPDPIYFIEQLWIEEGDGEQEEQNNKEK